jgi:hypothetical protein
VDLLQSSIWSWTCTTNQITQQFAKWIVGLKVKESTLNFILEIQNKIPFVVILQILKSNPIYNLFRFIILPLFKVEMTTPFTLNKSTIA